MYPGSARSRRTSHFSHVRLHALVFFAGFDSRFCFSSSSTLRFLSIVSAIARKMMILRFWDSFWDSGGLLGSGSTLGRAASTTFAASPTSTAQANPPKALDRHLDKMATDKEWINIEKMSEKYTLSCVIFSFDKPLDRRAYGPRSSLCGGACRVHSSCGAWR